jgi:hypothetical protein
MTDEVIESKVYCQWADSTVELKMLAESCDQYIKDGRCTLCATSDQIKLGMKPADLLRNIARK